jgi:hypothetical protein
LENNDDNSVARKTDFSYQICFEIVTSENLDVYHFFVFSDFFLLGTYVYVKPVVKANFSILSINPQGILSIRTRC